MARSIHGKSNVGMTANLVKEMRERNLQGPSSYSPATQLPQARPFGF
jgi:hypothetical protein